MNKQKQRQKSLKQQAKLIKNPKEQILFLYNNFKSNVVIRMIEKSFPETYQTVINKTQFLDTSKYKYSFATRLYYFLNDLSEYIRCSNPKCNKPLYYKNVRNPFDGYNRKGHISSHCNMNCAQQDSNVIQEHKDNYRKTHGVDSPFQNKELRKTWKRCDYKQIVETRKKNCLEKHGVECIQKTDEYKEKMRLLKQNISKEENELINEKRKQTCLEKYGVESIMQVPEIKEKMWDSYFEKTGYHHNSENPETIEKRKQAWNIKYNSNCQLNLKEMQKEIRERRKQRTGYEHHMLDPEFKKKNRQHLLETTGYEHNWANPEIRKKMYDNYKEKTGYDCPAVDPNVIAKMHKKYSYDGQTFDSKPEIAYYIWLKDNNIEFEYHPKQSFEYFDKNNNKHYYFPDFLVENEYVELKGCHFFFF